MKPAWSVTANGQDISARLADHLLELVIIDQSGIEADVLELRVADPRATVRRPALGSTLTAALGYAPKPLTPMGEWTLDSVSLELAPRVWVLRAHSADLRGGLRTRRSNGFEDIYLSNIVAVIAERNGLTPVVSKDLENARVARIDQTNESDISFLTRLGQLYDALVTVKSGHLILAKRGRGVTASGEPLPAVNLTLAEVSNGHFSHDEVEIYTAVEARWRNVITKEDVWIRAGSAPGEPGQDVTPEGVWRLRGLFPNDAAARAAAEAKLNAQARQSATLSLDLPGRTDIAAETPLQLTGFSADFDGRWIVTRAQHVLDENGYQLSLEAERPPDLGTVTIEPLIPIEE